MKHLLLLAAIACAPAAATAADWPHYRGPARDGHSTESSSFRDGAWLEKSPSWSANVGDGGASVLVVGDRLYTIGWRDNKDSVVCLDTANGKEQWRVNYPCREYGRHAMGDEGYYNGACATPEYDPATAFLYTLSVDGDLFCWDTRDKGRKVWSVQLYERYQAARRPKLTRAPQRDYGYTSCPLLFGDWLLVEVGAKAGNVIAFDKKTGAQRWASKCDDPAGHNGAPALMTVEGVPCLAVLTSLRLVVIRIDKGHEGELIATHPWITDFANNTAGPAVEGDCVLITSAYNHQTICKLKITLAGARKLWEKPVPATVCTPVIHKGSIYFTRRAMNCLDWETGAVKWQGGAFGEAGSCLVTADDRVIVWGAKGKLALIEGAERSPGKYLELSVRDGLFRDHAWPHVVLSDGRLYCKDRRGNLACFKISP